jgi:mono/diheme cytochrome c family protein
MRALATAAVLAASVAAVLSGSLAASPKPAAIYTAAQAAAGGKAYAASCAACHGENLEGGAGPALSGANLKTLQKSTHLTVSDLWEFVTLQMPMNAPGSLPKAQYAEIVAYILKFNGYPAGAKSLTPASADASKILVTSLK